MSGKDLKPWISNAFRYTQPPLSSQNFSNPCAATVSRFLHFSYLLISWRIFSLKWCKNWCKTDCPFILHHENQETVGAVGIHGFEQDGKCSFENLCHITSFLDYSVVLRNLEGPIESHHCFNLFVPECLCVSFHCSSYVPVSHNILKNLKVDILFAHACAESVSQDMSANFWKIARLTILFPRPCILFLVVGGRDALDCVVDKGLRIDLPVMIEENEGAISIHNKFFPFGSPLPTLHAPAVRLPLHHQTSGFHGSPLLSLGQISYNDCYRLPLAYRAGHGLHE